MGWIQLVLAVLSIIVKIWDAIKERNDELRKKKTEVLQSGVRGIIDRDASRITRAFDDLNRL